jgi:lactoylglutathione lyase
MTSTRSATHITDVRTVGIPTNDQDRAVGFYVDTLGFEVRLDVPMGEGARWIEVAPPGATTSIALIAAEGNQGVVTGVRFTTTDAGADQAALRSRGVDVDEVLRWDGVPPMFTFRDQDCNTLVIVEQP